MTASGPHPGRSLHTGRTGQLVASPMQMASHGALLPRHGNRPAASMSHLAIQDVDDQGGSVASGPTTYTVAPAEWLPAWQSVVRAASP
jgi:hypothetical protein